MLVRRLQSNNLRVSLLEILKARLNKEELGEVAFRLGIDYDDLRGESKTAKAISLIEHLAHRERLPELVQVGKELRPDIRWPLLSEVEQGEGHSSAGHSGSQKLRRTRGLSSDTLNTCLRVFERCAEFEKDGTLRSLFVTESLKPFQGRVPQAGSIRDRVSLFIDAFADVRTASGEWVLIEFVEALLPRYEGTGTYSELQQLKRMLERDFGMAR